MLGVMEPTLISVSGGMVGVYPQEVRTLVCASVFNEVRKKCTFEPALSVHSVGTSRMRKPACFNE